MRATVLLRALPTGSCWRDQMCIQGLLRRRQAFLWDHLSTYAADVLTSARARERWPTAERAAIRWREALVAALGEPGSEDWLARSGRLPPPRAPCGRGGGPRLAAQRAQDSGVLVIRHIKAWNLRRADFWDPSDPYVVFEFAGQSCRTSVVYNNEDNPHWAGEEMIFEVASLAAAPVLEVSVWDWDGFSKHDPLGRVDEEGLGLNVQDVLEGVQSEMQYLGSSHDVPTRACCQGCRLVLRGDGAGNRGAAIAFEVVFAEGGNADPLRHTQEEEPMLRYIASVERQIAEFSHAFKSETAGFFLPPLDLDGRSLGSFAPGGGEAWVASKEHAQAVTDYNRLLDRLSILAAEAPGSAPVDVADFWPGVGVDTPARAADLQLVRLRAQIAQVERNAANDPALLEAIARQDDVLPSIGQWSCDRRRRLRDEVFLLGLQLRRTDLFCLPVWIWSPCLLALLLCGGTTACTVAVVRFPRALALETLFTVACVASLCYLASSCYVQRLSGDRTRRGKWPSTRRSRDSGGDYVKVATDEGW
uniref:C2 domain-containing protein n=1 Tax=Zooxanthella nutricula TaxID=1333877 RepID=A0A7S2JC52_9DINO